MASRIINRLNLAIQKFENIIANILRQRFPPEALCAIEYNHVPNLHASTRQTKPFSLENILGDGILWAVPKHRRTVERRWQRKFGHPLYNWKPLVPKTNLLVCTNCGHNYEAGVLCGHCYNKVKAETKEMQDAIYNDLDLSPVEKDVIVLYEGENDAKAEEYWKNKRVVELPKKRPSWFQQNLLQQTTQQPSDSKEVEPTQLG